MPRSIDYTQGNETDWNEVRIPDPRYGKNEIAIKDYNELIRATGVFSYSFTPQFSTYSKPDPENRIQVMDAAHEWLSQNMTGPWFWHEDWRNHGHHIDTTVYIERLTDQKAFQEAFSHVFGYHESSDYELEQGAVLRGVLPLLTSRESFLSWGHENSGYKVENIDEKTDPRIVRFSFTIPALKEKFKADWGDVFAQDKAAIEPDGYVGPWLYGHNRDMMVWLSQNGAMGNMSGGPSENGYIWKFEARFPETIAAVQRDWGHVFQWDEGKSVFVASTYPSSPPRAIPEDFMAYIRGEQDDYAAPYADTLMPKRSSQQAAPDGIAPVLGGGKT